MSEGGRVIVKFKGVTPFEASMALVYLCVVWCLDAHDLAIAGGNLEVAAHATVGTNCTGRFGCANRFRLKDIEIAEVGRPARRRRSSHNQTQKALIISLDNAAVKTAASHASAQTAPAPRHRRGRSGSS